jgi:hypothetical protein
MGEAVTVQQGDGVIVTTRNTVVKRGGGTVLVYEPVRLIRGRTAQG